MIYMIIDLMSGAVFALLLAWAFMAFCKNGSLKRFLWISLFTIYLCEMFNVVGVPAAQYFVWEPTINLIPFGDEKNLRFFFQIGMNAVMFMPFGFMLPILWRKCRTWKKTVLAGFLTSLAIEIVQLFSFRATDVDDLIMNTLGTFLGYIISRAIFNKKWKKDCENEEGRVNEWISLFVSVLIPLLVIIFIRTLVSNRIYSMPMFD